MHDPQARQPVIRLALLIAAAVTTGAFADTIKIERLAYPGVTILGLKEGQVFYSVRGAEQEVSLSRVTAIELDRYPAFAEAAQQIEAGEAAAAAMKLQALKARVRERRLKPLVQAKFVEALDAAGRFDQAVKEWVELATQDNSDEILRLMPENLPTDEADRKQAADAVEQRIRLVQDPLVKRSLQQLREQLLAQPEPQAPAAEPGDGAAAASPSVAAGGDEGVEIDLATSGDPISNLIKAGQLEEALEQINNALDRRGASLSRLLYQRGVTQAALDRDKDAALSFMRVVIHFSPTSQWYTPALIEAGKVMQRLGQPEHARTLWSEAVAQGDEEQEQQAQQLLDALE
jgi:tetratricopeptide (TPR) repeat protein